MSTYASTLAVVPGFFSLRCNESVARPAAAARTAVLMPWLGRPGTAVPSAAQAFATGVERHRTSSINADFGTKIWDPPRGALG